MDGLNLAVLYSFGCNMGVVTGVDRHFLDFLRDQKVSEQKRKEIVSILEDLNPYVSYCSLAGLMKYQDVFEEQVVRAYWFGNGQARRDLSHNFQVLTEIESMRANKRLPAKAINKMLNCLVSFGKILESRTGRLTILHHGLLCDRRGDYLWQKEKREIESGFVKNLKRGKWVSVHIFRARENINKSQARLLRETTTQAMRATAGLG